MKDFGEWRRTVTRTPKNKCLACGYVIDAASSTPDYPDNPPPSPGDIALCLNCAHLHLFADDLTLRELTDAEMVEVAGDPEMLHAVEAIGRANRLRER
jgi:hypothetical protein